MFCDCVCKIFLEVLKSCKELYFYLEVIFIWFYVCRGDVCVVDGC
jgi:hypothetical protein